jgi:Fe-S-cluster-containing dehydrogenase component/anaerobic selenocysteine-containing dehydrogenase
MENQTPETFNPPRHWIAPEELSPSYWADPKNVEKRGQEFADKPIETIALIDKLDTKGIARREFMTIMGASMAMAGFACARRPVHKIIPYVVKPEEVSPGVANFYASTDPETGYGLLIKVREGRPVKLEGNPEHPVNKGRLSARQQSAILDLYDPERLQEPVSRSRTTGTTAPARWKELDGAISQKLASGAKVRVVTGALHSDSTRRLIAEFLSAFPGSAHVEFEPLAMDDIALGQEQAYGTALMPVYRFDQAETVVSIGADFLGTWPESVGYAADWAKGRKLDSKNSKNQSMSKLVSFESMMTVTGANSDERYPIRPGDELKVAGALANALGGGAAFSSYNPDTVAQDLGIAGGGEVFRKLAAQLRKSGGKSLVVAGSVQAKSKDAVALQVAVNFINSQTGAEGSTVDGTGAPVARPMAGFAGMQKLIQDLNAGSVDVLILHRVNPAYALPASAGFAAAVKKAGMVVAVSDRVDETALLADFVLPDHHALENWGDARIRKGVYSLQQPVLAPIFSSRSFQDNLLAWIAAGNLKASGLAARVAASPSENTWHDYVMANWKETVFPLAGGGSFQQFWETSLRDGVFVQKGVAGAKGSARPFRPAALSKVPAFQASPGLKLALYASMAQYDGRTANNAWLQEMPDPVTTITWDNFLAIGPGLAKRMGFKSNDVAKVQVGDRTLELPVQVQPGLHDDTASVALGYGRRNAGKVGDGVGVDVFPLAQVDASGLVFAGMPVQISKTGKFYRLAETQSHHVTENRPVINDLSIAQFRENPGMSNHTDPHLRMETVPTMWSRHEYKGYRWGMAIDLNSCIGCQACVIGCQAENNIPVVGRNNVRVSREMHWIRIDRYYSGTPENPDVVFQPMLCQHCENAPCETVCPVLATVHDDEGINNQVYNRCVGTRYCSNNCPYKVRRFNFFDHWKNYEGTANLVWNPDVTVRTRGIMEKCTFCIQRIQKTRFEKKNKGEKIQDGDVMTACQQTCPTDAIVFGNMNDPESRVSKLMADQRAFRSLEILNTRPSVSYLTKVRNKETVAGAHHHGGDHHG